MFISDTHRDLKIANENNENKEYLKKRAQSHNNIPKHNYLCRLEKITIINFTEHGMYIFMTNTYGYLLPRKITIIIFPEHDIYIFKSDRHREHEKH